MYCTNILKTTISKSTKKRYRLHSATWTVPESGSGNPTWVNTSTVFRTPRWPQHINTNVENYLKALHKERLIIQNMAIVRVKLLPRRIC